MKVFVAILVLCLADGLLAGIAHNHNNDSVDAEFHASAKACFVESGLDPALADLLSNTDNAKEPETLPPKDKMDCVYACISKKVGFFTADGKVAPVGDSEENYTKWTPEKITECTKEANGDVCKLAGCLEETHKIYED